MPGIAHLFYGFILGFLLRWATDNKFDIRYVIVFGVNCWVGPDIGAITWYFTRGISDELSFWILMLFHNPYVFPLTLGPFLAYFWAWATALTTTEVNGKLKIVRDKNFALRPITNYLLITAGSYSHFLYDYLFDANGHQKPYLWVLSTGWWDGHAYFDKWIIIPAIITAAFILLILYFNNPPHPENYKRQMKASAIITFISLALYEVYLAVRISQGVPALGEEADFGVNIFISVFLFFPIFLCILATRIQERKK